MNSSISKTKILILLTMLFLTASCSTSPKEIKKIGSFTYECPSNISLEEKSVIENENYVEIHYLTYKGNKKYERTYLFGQTEDEVFEVTIYLKNKEKEKTISDYDNELRASLTNGGFWTVFDEIENKPDSKCFKATLNHKETQDYGVQYYRLYEKEGKLAVIQITVREEANKQYKSTLITILKSVK